MVRIAGNTESAPAPAGAYSQSVRSGRIVWAAGQGGFDPDTGDLVGADVASQARQALTNLAAVLRASGAELSEVVRVGVFLISPDDFQRMNEVYAKFFDDPPPARTTVCVGLPGAMRVEVDAMAVVVG